MRKKSKLPTSFCASCNHCNNKYCNTFKRPVDTSFNRCSYHSNFQPVQTVFKVSSTLDKIIELEEAERKRRDKIWEEEQESISKSIKKEIELAKQLKGEVA